MTKLSEAVEVIETLSPILNKTDDRSALKIFKDVVILKIINIVAPSKREKILLSLPAIIMFSAYMLKILKLKYLIFSYVAIAIFLINFILSITGIFKNNPRSLANSSYSSRLTNSIIGKHRTRLESALDPEVSDFELKEIEEKLSNLNTVQIDAGILCLSWQKELIDKEDKYTEKFISYFLILGIVLIYGTQYSQVMIGSAGLLFVYFEYSLHGNSMSAKLGFCLNLLKKIKILKDES